MKKICVVTGTRAEYGLFYPVLKKIQASRKLQLQLVVTTMHLASEYGNTVENIRADGFEVDAVVENLLAANSNTAICKSTGLALMMLADVYQRLQPDVVLLLGDRFETHAAATCALLMNIPIGHIHGGEISEGAIDEQIRHSITKMAHVHFTSTDTYRNRVIQMGENPNMVFVSGAPGIDNILNMDLLTKSQLESELNWRFGKKNILFTYHPETVGSLDNKQVIGLILSQIGKLPEDYHVLCTYANADEGGAIINKALESFVKTDQKRFKVVKNLGQLRYLSAMNCVDVLVGNTSSGIIEAVSFHKPVVNIGDRQKGRFDSGNVVHCGFHKVTEAIKEALAPEFIDHCQKAKNIYGNGNAAEIIVEALALCSLSVVKKFCDVGGSNA
ncbi:UDP-N-acetylglucosamine 2-epimerase [Cysteiniphilum halobium]|uniref:UDP-N-acetylglucosamine 2-epimerase n=1 Tax=Cysteiniphilum halobium TaxID=2219059 RepID=UPI003F830AE1